MSNVQQIANVLYSALGLVALWYLVICWREYKTDKLRQDIFNLRAELFEYARTSAISFDDPLYRRLRMRLDSMIRFAHQISFVRLAVTVLWEKVHPLMPDVPIFTDELRANQPLSAEARAKLASIHQRMMKITAQHVLTTSFLALPMLALYCTYSIVKIWATKSCDH